MPIPASTPSGLPRRIGLWSAVAVVVGSAIGSGIFRSPAGIADRVPGPLPLIALWVIGGLISLCGALTLAEVASEVPKTGGIYAFLKEGWGRLPAFLFGWAQLTVVRAAALGAISITFAEYFWRVFGYDPTVAPYDQWARYTAAAAIVLTATFNIVGVRVGSAVVNVTTIAKTSGLGLIIILALTLGLRQTGGNFTPAMPQEVVPATAYGAALVSLLWAYDGWMDLSYVAGEVKDPQRNMPRALIFGTLAIIAVFVLANVAYLAVLPIGEMRQSKLVAADVAQQLMGQGGVTFVAVTVMASTFGTLNAVLLTSPRILFAAAADGMLPKAIAKVHAKYETPYVAISLVAVLGTIFVLFLRFEELADAFVFAMLPFYAGGVAAVYRLRARPGYAPGFKTPGYPLVPAIFLLAVVYLLVNGLLDSGTRSWTLGIFGVLLLGIPVFKLFVERRS
ncbi:MAG: APC family permease [Gemmatimonadaceae bacterium]